MRQFRTPPDTLVIHCSDTYASQDIGAAEIRQWHTKERGWDDIGYHFVIRRDGRVELGRDLRFEGAHVEGHNSHTIGICMVGGKSRAGGGEDNFTSEQLTALAALIVGLKAVLGTTAIKGHHDFNPAKLCPVLDVPQFLSQFKIAQH